MSNCRVEREKREGWGRVISMVFLVLRIISYPYTSFSVFLDGPVGKVRPISRPARKKPHKYYGGLAQIVDFITGLVELIYSMWV